MSRFLVDTGAWYANADRKDPGRAASRGQCRRARSTRRDETRAWEIFVRYRDQRFSYTDCTSFAAMQRLRIDTAIALDEDFRAFGLACLP